MENLEEELSPEELRPRDMIPIKGLMDYMDRNFSKSNDFYQVLRENPLVRASYYLLGMYNFAIAVETTVGIAYPIVKLFI